MENSDLKHGLCVPHRLYILFCSWDFVAFKAQMVPFIDYRLWVVLENSQSTLTSSVPIMIVVVDLIGSGKRLEGVLVASLCFSMVCAHFV